LENEYRRGLDRSPSPPSLILDQLAGGTSIEELLSDYPQLKREDVLAAIAYGAEVSRERIIPVPTA
jgi:uncharacterized protein (DUF433 family)